MTTQSRWLEHAGITIGRYGAKGEATPRPAVTHEHVAFAFYLRGHARHRHGDVELKVAEGDVLLVPAGEPHALVTAKDPEAWGIGFCSACYASSELAPLLAPFSRARQGASPVVRIPPERRSALGALCEALDHEVNAAGPDAHSELAQRSLLTLILTEVSRASTLSAPAGTRGDVVGDALEYIERRCLEPLTLAQVAAAISRSPSHVTTALRRTTGRSAVEWIITGRMTEARRRLAHTAESIEVIAEKVGYADPTHFIRLFRRTHGVTPAAWRQELRSRGTLREGR